MIVTDTETQIFRAPPMVVAHRLAVRMVLPGVPLRCEYSVKLPQCRQWPILSYVGRRERRGCEEHLGGLRPRLPPGGIDVIASCSPLKNPKTKKMHNLQTETFTSLQNNKSLKSQQHTTFFALVTISCVVWPKVQLHTKNHFILNPEKNVMVKI